MTLQRQESMTSKIVKLVSTFDMQTWGIMIAITIFQVKYLTNQFLQAAKML
jgi:hypothetical protein